LLTSLSPNSQELATPATNGRIVGSIGIPML
jgi:hypothetical protein